MVRILGSTGTRRRRTWLALGTAAALTFLAIPATSFANLAGSTFEGNDGNLVHTGANTDWDNVAGLNTGTDNLTGPTDNSFGQGTKEDNADVTVVTGSIPPNKSDLTRFYEASETVSGSTFLYLAWERTNVLGSANMDFEINQASTPNLGSPGKHTIVRTAGDLLVTYDFTNGGTKPTLGLNTWLTSATNPVVPGFLNANVCLSSNSFPCWGDHIALNATNSEGAINTVAVTDPHTGNTLAVNTFGEAAINLTGSGVFPPGVCKGFGSAFLKSRASASFGAEVKDFVAPVPVNISNCGRVIIRKVTVPSPDTIDSFAYTTTGGLSPSTFNLKDGEFKDYGGSVAVGSYSVTETDPGPNFKLTSLDCSASSLTNGSTIDGTDTTTGTVSFTLKADDVIDCTYTNTRQLGAIKITKTSIKGPTLAGATFTIKDPNGNEVPGSPATTGNDGTVCVDNLPFNTYSVQETAAPAGYEIDDSTAHDVSVTKTSTCGDGNEAMFSAHDTPLTDVVVSATSEAAGGTESTITCTPAIGNSPQGPGESVTVTASGLKPGTYDCTVVIDP
jgi:hypothetical protein